MKFSDFSKLKLISSMLIFGTVGIFVKYIPIPSDIIAMIRGSVGAVFLFVISLIRKKSINPAHLKKKALPLLISGGFIGINWILLFEAYKHTTVATATLCYYLAPIFVILASPFFLGEKLTAKKLLCSLTALCGMVFVSGVAENGIPRLYELKGIFFGIGAAIFYATVIILNKKITDIPAFDRTFFQLGSAAIVLLPYSILSGSINQSLPSPTTLILIFTVGIIHTGIAYLLYFSSMEGLSAHTVAIMSYIDPISAIILSSMFFPDEKLTLYGAIGGILILGATLVSEISFSKK